MNPKFFCRGQAIFLLFFCMTIFQACGNDSSNTGSNGKNDSGSVAPADAGQPGPDGQLPAQDPGISPAGINTTVPVFAILAYDQSRRFDGLYDSVSGYLHVCGTNDLIQVTDRNKLTLNPDNKCYSQAVMNDMIAISENGKPTVFATVVNVDAEKQKLLAVTDRHDTLVISTLSMKPVALEKVKASYMAKPPLKQEQVEKVRQSYQVREKQVQMKVRPRQ